VNKDSTGIQKDRQMAPTNSMQAGSSPPNRYEFIDSGSLAERWRLPESWIREQVRTRSRDPIPHVRFGKYVRFRWGSPELEEWAERRIVSSSKRVVGRLSERRANEGNPSPGRLFVP